MAKEAGLTVAKTEDLKRTEPDSIPGLGPDGVEALFSLAAGQVSDSAIPVAQGYMLAKVVEAKPEETEPLEAVRGKVVAALKLEKGRGEAKTRLAALLEKAKTGSLPADLGPGVELVAASQPFGRNGFVPQLGMNQGLAQAAFTAKQGAWLPEVYQIGELFFIARITKRTPPPQASWDKEKDGFMIRLQRSKKQELLMAFLESLRQKAIVEIVNPQVLE